MQQNLKNRIALYYLLLTALLVAVVFVILFKIVHITVYNHLDSKLWEEVNDIRGSIAFVDNQLDITNPLEWNESEHAHTEVNPTFVQVRGPKGEILKTSVNLFGRTLEYRDNYPYLQYFNSKLGESLIRQVQAPILSNKGELLGYILVAVPRTESVLVLTNLQRVLFIGYPLVLILLFAFTRVIAGSLMKPLNKVISTADRITRENLEERIPVPKHRDELQVLAKTINDLLDRLNEVIQREKQFTSDASHELRTPLSVIKGTLEVLVRKPRKTEEYVKKINYCIAEVNRMANLVEQLLMLTRHESRQEQLNLRQLLPEDLVTNALSRLETQIRQKKIRVSLNSTGDNYIYADCNLTETIFENVLSNAVKYSPDSASIQVDIFQENGSVICRITDEGIGMTEEELKRAFDRFYRTSYSHDSKTEGSGIGLSLVKRLAELQQIDIHLKSEKHRGTVFELHFPIPMN